MMIILINSKLQVLLFFFFINFQHEYKQTFVITDVSSKVY